MSPAALGPSRGEFDFGAESAGDLFARRQKHAIAMNVVGLHYNDFIVTAIRQSVLKKVFALGLIDGKHVAEILTRSRQGLVNDVF